MIQGSYYLTLAGWEVFLEWNGCTSAMGGIEVRREGRDTLIWVGLLHVIISAPANKARDTNHDSVQEPTKGG